MEELHDLAAERIILRRLFTDKQYLQKSIIAARWKQEHFSDLSYRDAYRAIIVYFKQYGTIPTSQRFRPFFAKFITPVAFYKDKKKQIKIWLNSADKLFTQLSEQELEHFQHDADRIESLYKGRLISTTLERTIKSFDKADYESSLAEMSKALLTIATSSNGILEGNVVDDWEQHKNIFSLKRSGLIKPVKIGLFGAIEDESGELDKILFVDEALYGGLYPGDFVIYLGEIKVGKSIVLLDNGYSAALSGKNVAFFTIEMDKWQQEWRFYNKLTTIPFWKYRAGKLSDKEIRFTEKRLEQWKEKCGLFHIISYRGGMTVRDVEQKLTQLQQQLGVRFDLCVLDYITDMKSEDGKSTLEWGVLDKIAGGLADLAKGFNEDEGIPIVTANQKSGSSAGKSTSAWTDSAFAKSIGRHVTLQFGLGQDKVDRVVDRICITCTGSRFIGGNMSFFVYPNKQIGKISSMKRLKRYYNVEE